MLGHFTKDWGIPMDLDDQAGVAAPRGLEGPQSRADLPLVLLASGYNLRMINGFRVRLDGRAERATLLLLLWLAARLADPDPTVAGAAAQALGGLLPMAPPESGCLSLRQIERATWLPRETVRRTATRLEALGLVEHVGAERLAVTARFAECLHDCDEQERLADFRWTAARMRELSHPTADGAAVSVADALAAMRSCRSEELRASLRWPTPPEPAPGLLAAALMLMHGHNLRHLLRLAPLFDGDLLQVVVLGEVSHRNIAVLSPHLARTGEPLASVLKLSQPDQSILTDPRRGMNAYSLASCLAIPYETLRRKLARLVQRQFLQRDHQGRYWVSPHLADLFRPFNRERRADLLATAEQIETLLGAARAGDAPQPYAGRSPTLAGSAASGQHAPRTQPAPARVNPSRRDDAR